MNNHPDQPLSLVLIGGSSGTLMIFEEILKLMTKPVASALVFVLHRSKDSTAVFPSLFKGKTEVSLCEPQHLDSIENGKAYFAVPDYHLLIGPDHRFYYDASEKDFFSRPSLDATFISAAFSGITIHAALLLSGSNADGAAGLKILAEKGFKTYVLDPEEAASPRMPGEAIALFDQHAMLTAANFSTTISQILY
jgi:two-component system, chemotaxis family, protein-glutamate methylesterase/glutaminase